MENLEKSLKSYFHIDLNNFPLERIFERIFSGKIYKSRKILTVDAEEIFDKFISSGIISCQEFINRVSNKKKIVLLAEMLEISEEYVTMLKREVQSYKTKPVNFADIPEIEDEVIECLDDNNIIHTKHFFDLAFIKDLRSSLQKKLNFTNEQMFDLLNMSDLSRINGVGPVFIRLNLDAGITSAKQFATSTAEEIDQWTKKINNEKSLTRILPKISELEMCQHYAELLPDVIEY